MAQATDELLTVKEAAALLKVSPYTIYRWVGSGRLRAVRPAGRMVRLRRSDLDHLSIRKWTPPVTDNPPRKGTAAALRLAVGIISPEAAAELRRVIAESRERDAEFERAREEARQGP